MAVVDTLFDYIKGQGRVFMCDRDGSGNPDGKWIWLGDVPNFEMGQAPETLNVKENYTGARGNALSLVTALDTTFSLTLRNLAPDVAKLLMAGAKVSVTGGSASNETLPNPVAVGDFYLLRNAGVISNLVITDSAGSPATLTAGTHYEHDGSGLVTIKALTGTQPYKAAYDFAAKTRVLVQNVAIANKVLRFHGLNTARKNSGGGFARFDLILYNCSLTPGESVPFIQEDEIAEITFAGTFDVDTTKATTSTTSQYGELNYVDIA